MALPAPNTPWPPAAIKEVAAEVQAWTAWWTGDEKGLRESYSESTTTAARPSQLAGGVYGAVGRWFWGRPSHDLTNPVRRVHIPIAGEICQASADLVFAERPTVKVEAGRSSNRAQARFDEVSGEDFWSAWHRAAEIAAAQGAAFIRVTVDTDVSEAPFLTVEQLANSIPEFRWGKLVGVMFWWELPVESTSLLGGVLGGVRVFRHVERHELDEFGNGVVLHALYEGTPDSLGSMVPLTEHSATAGLAVDERGAAVAMPQTPGLGVVLVSNGGTSRRLRNNPVGSHLGRSDLEGIESLLDQIDETASDWTRARRLARPRILVSSDLLDDGGPGGGAAFNVDREVFTEIPNLSAGGTKSGLPIEPVEFKFSTDQYQATFDALVKKAIEGAGYSASTFGESGSLGGAALTATEIRAREARSYRTRDRKTRALSSAIEAAVFKLLSVDAALGAEGVIPATVTVTFPDGVTESPKEKAEVARAMADSGSYSLRERVRYAHPDWEDSKIDAEVQAITEDKAAATPPALQPFQSSGADDSGEAVTPGA